MLKLRDGYTGKILTEYKQIGIQKHNPSWCLFQTRESRFLNFKNPA